MELKVHNFAQVRKAEIELGDLTVLVGPQAAGKSILLQLLKLAIDKRFISSRMWGAGLTWKNEKDFLDLYLGEGMSSGWKSSTQIWVDEKPLTLTSLQKTGTAPEKVFFIPAHRAMLFTRGWPNQFEQFGPDTPVVARLFSYAIHKSVTRREPERRQLFPVPHQIKKDIRDKIASAVFPGGGEVFLEERLNQRRLTLVPAKGLPGLPFMTWTAGQRESTPLLLGLGYVSPAGGAKRKEPFEIVVIEEPEMGLHPKALEAFMLAILDLLHRRYRVLISTHSPILLDFIWGIRTMAERGVDPRTLLKMFGVSKRHDMVALAGTALKKDYRVFAVLPKDGASETKDITDLDPGSGDPDIASWGGLTEFSGRISNAVARSSSAEGAG